MKVTKLIILAMLGLFAVDGNAQRNGRVATNVYFGDAYHTSNNSSYSYSSQINFYARELRLNRRQTRRLNDVLQYYDSKINRVNRNRYSNNRARRNSINRLLRERDYEVRNVLSRRQYAKYLSIRDFEQRRRSNYRCSAHGSCSNGACYDSYYRNRYDDGWNDYWNGDRRRDWDRRYGNDDFYDERDRRDNRDQYDGRDEDWNYREQGNDDWRDSRDDDRRRTNSNDDRQNSGKIVEDVKVESDAPFDVDDSEEAVADLSEEDEMDAYFRDEVDYGDDDELDDYFADEN